MGTFRCAACGAINRVREDATRAAAPGTRPVCGRCGRALDLSGDPQPVTADALLATIRSAPVPVLVDFWAAWCGPCRVAAPVFRALGRERAGDLLVLKVDTDAEQALAARLGIQAIPTFVLFRGGEEAARHSGVLRQPELARWVDAASGARSGQGA